MAGVLGLCLSEFFTGYYIFEAVWLVVSSILLHWRFTYGSGIFEMELPFSTGLLVADTSGGNMTLVLYSIIPVPFLLWLFSGRMELIMDQAYAQITTLVYYTGSLFVYGSIQHTEILPILNMLLYPNLGYAMRNGVLGGDLVGNSMIEILVVCVLLIYISLKTVDKKDIM